MKNSEIYDQEHAHIDDTHSHTHSKIITNTFIANIYLYAQIHPQSSTITHTSAHKHMKNIISFANIQTQWCWVKSVCIRLNETTNKIKRKSVKLKRDETIESRDEKREREKRRRIFSWVLKLSFNSGTNRIIRTDRRTRFVWLFSFRSYYTNVHNIEEKKKAHTVFLPWVDILEAFFHEFS